MMGRAAPDPHRTWESPGAAVVIPPKKTSNVTTNAGETNSRGEEGVHSALDEGPTTMHTVPGQRGQPPTIQSAGTQQNEGPHNHAHAGKQKDTHTRMDRGTGVHDDDVHTLRHNDDVRTLRHNDDVHTLRLNDDVRTLRHNDDVHTLRLNDDVHTLRHNQHKCDSTHKATQPREYRRTTAWYGDAPPTHPPTHAHRHAPNHAADSCQ